MKKKAPTRAARRKKLAPTAAERSQGPSPAPARGVDLVAIRKLALALPSVEEGTSYGTPAFRVKDRLFLRLHQNGEDLVVRLDDDLCERLLATEAHVFHKTPHYEGHPYVLARLGSLTEARLRALLDDAWDLSAPRVLREARAWPHVSR